MLGVIFKILIYFGEVHFQLGVLRTWQVILLRFSQTCKFLKFKSQLMIAFFPAVNHLNRPPVKQNFTSTGSKGHGL